jgi:hypothetical protein
MIVNKYNILQHEYKSLKGLLNKVNKELELGKNGTISFDPNQLLEYLNIILHEGNNSSAILRQISGLPIEINGSLKNGLSIYNAIDTYKAGISNDFINYKTQSSDVNSSNILVQVYEIISNATLQDIFNDIYKEFEKSSLKQYQIINFCRDYSEWLVNTGHSTFFLFKHSLNYFVVLVRIIDSKLNVKLLPVNNKNIWDSKYTRRVIIPFYPKSSK